MVKNPNCLEAKQLAILQDSVAKEFQELWLLRTRGPLKNKSSALTAWPRRLLSSMHQIRITGWSKNLGRNDGIEVAALFWTLYVHILKLIRAL